MRFLGSGFRLKLSGICYKAEKGVSAFQLQQWLGHANLNTTQIYVHLGKQNARKVMQDTSLV
jgi:site-specific recombinase XerD